VVGAVGACDGLFFVLRKLRIRLRLRCLFCWSCAVFYLRRVAIRIFGFWPRSCGRFGFGRDGVAVFEEDALQRFVPFALVVDQGAGADGSKHGGGGRRDGFAGSAMGMAA
jgi:hypothetical protein